ncbi:MAG: hypothetical protein ANABAC_3193 [Anaerolineae bacterium]|nr:MAG: hypothetical protein ANABAC_3193 [Anaerolineae bacterium]
MLGKQNSTAEKPERFSLSTPFPAHHSQNSPVPGELSLSTASLNSPTWLPRLFGLFKALLGEPSTTTLADLNQENP